MQKEGPRTLAAVRCIDDIVLEGDVVASCKGCIPCSYTTSQHTRACTLKTKAENKMRQNSGSYQVCRDAWLQRPGWHLPLLL